MEDCWDNSAALMQMGVEIPAMTNDTGGGGAAHASGGTSSSDMNMNGGGIGGNVGGGGAGAGVGGSGGGGGGGGPQHHLPINADHLHQHLQDQQDQYYQAALNAHHHQHQLLVSGQTTTAAPGSSPVSAGGSLSPSGSGPGTLSPGGASNSGGPPTSQCCESGRPLVTDPVTGQSVCSCQYDSARLAALQYPRTMGMYGTSYPSTDQNPYPSIGVDSSAFYSPLTNPYALKDAGGPTEMSAWTSAGLQPTTGYYPYDPALAAYGYGAGYDLAARRKNATRESTATLKAWLNEHKKNPYPTKGEKIMLAIITKMTLTQVSTWFANARRRLKKENKMTWEPKNKTDDDDDTLASDTDDKDNMDDDMKRDGPIDMHHHNHHHRIKTERNALKDLDDEDLVDDERKEDLLVGGVGAGGLLPHHHHMLGNGYSIGGKTDLKSTDCGVPLPPSKPKIWSLADTAACKTPPPPPSTHHWATSNGGAFLLPSSARYGSGAGNGGFLPSHHCHQQGFPDLQTDTPPQTPPNMKLPSMGAAGGGGGGGGGGIPNHVSTTAAASLPCNSSIPGGGGGGGGYGFTANSNFGRLQSPHRGGMVPSMPQAAQLPPPSAGSDVAAAFKPFYKR